MKKRFKIILLLFTFSGFMIYAQDQNFDENMSQLIEGYDSKSVSNNQVMISDDALFWVSHASNSEPFGHDVTYKDTIFVSQLFMPPLFRPRIVLSEIIEFNTSFVGCIENRLQYPFYEPVKVFSKEKLKLQIENRVLWNLQRNQLSLFHHSVDNLPSETVSLIVINEKPQIMIEQATVNPTEYDLPKKFIPDRKYWTSSFESAVKFSENSTSDNWHSSPTKRTILNIFTRNIVKYNYEKDLIKWDNDMEVKLNFYNSPNDTLRKYKVSDDLLKLHSNFGVKAFKKWHYTFDGEFRTQLFSNYQENTDKRQSTFLSPFTINLGLGMKYDHTQKFERIDRSVVLSINFAPLSFTYMRSINDSINWGRYGFPKDEVTGEYKTYLSKLGSTVDFNITVKPNWDVTWKSRLKYFTSYNQVIAEFENSLDFAVSQYFSTLLYLHIRYDDGVTKTNVSDSYLQWSQLVSFGFNYKW